GGEDLVHQPLTPAVVHLRPAGDLLERTQATVAESLWVHRAHADARGEDHPARYLPSRATSCRSAAWVSGAYQDSMKRSSPISSGSSAATTSARAIRRVCSIGSRGSASSVDRRSMARVATSA